MIMNEPVELMSFNDADIIREYMMFKDIKRTARVFDTSTSEIRKVLKKADVLP